MKNIFITIILLITLNFTGILVAQQSTVFTKTTTLFKDKPLVHFKFKINSRQEIKYLTRIISIDNVKNNEVYAYATEAEFNKFLELGYGYEIINDTLNPADIVMSNQASTRDIQTWNYYPTYTAYDSMMTAFNTNYPSLCKIINIKTLASGRKILLAKISKNVGIKEKEPVVLYTSSIHGDELTGYILSLRLIEYLLSNYGTDPRITRMLDSTEIWINPLANPDGTFHGGNTSVTGAIRNNANNVDLNRNYPDRLVGDHPDFGTWQPETVAFMGLADTVNFSLSVNFHGGEEVCNYPWDCTDSLGTDEYWWQYVCREWVDTIHLITGSGYMNGLSNGITNGAAWYMVNGGRQDYMNYFHHCKEFTCENSINKTPAASQLLSYWNYNWRSLLNYIEQSHYGLQGVVTDSITGQPLKAKVYISGFDKDSSDVNTFLPFGNYYRYLLTGTYNVTYSAPGYISKTISASVVNRTTTYRNVQLVPTNISTGDELKVNANSLDIFPNPVSNYIQLNFKKATPLYTLNICDAKGASVFERTYSNTEKSVRIELPNLNKGVYFIKITSEDFNTIKKIIIK